MLRTNDQLTDDEAREYVRAALKRSGPPKNLIAKAENRRKVLERLLDEQDALTHKYPRKWAVMGEDGLIVVSDSFDEAVTEIKGRGISRDDVQVEYLDPNPQPMMTPHHLLPQRPPAL